MVALFPPSCTSLFLQSSGLLPFAVLSQSSDRVEVLQQVAQVIDRISDSQVQGNVAASAFVLAGLVLDKEVVQLLLRRDIMRESVTYQLIQEEAKAQERQIAMQEVALKMLREGMAIDAKANVTGLSVEQIQQLQAACR